MIDRDAILAMIPHQGSMCLLDRVLDWNDERIHCQSEAHLRANLPLRSGGRLRGVHLCEFGAQSMAVHGGLLARASGGRAQPGLLVALRGVRISHGVLPALPGPLDVFGDKLAAGETGWQYAFRVKHAGELLAEGRAAVMPAPCGMNLSLR
ncbi:phosphotransferase [Pseudomarimonas salicorniae]|uniref:Phosphotransferase n=1 Tax=Pseudomarimonas salicorniae TaxID=2933270 RepID=A0ABT0GDF5_9GAMM|nr:phosphotransferase [Lysobacter sp. CAU 1642]MCK7592367.1 phosphotransferase [Lysobacter sp. CAU 1642]